MATAHQEAQNSTEELVFMSKARFDAIRARFAGISDAALTAIDNADDDDILAITMAVNSPVKVIEARIVKGEDFIEMAF